MIKSVQSNIIQKRKEHFRDFMLYMQCDFYTEIKIFTILHYLEITNIKM